MIDMTKGKNKIKTKAIQNTIDYKKRKKRKKKEKFRKVRADYLPLKYSAYSSSESLDRSSSLFFTVNWSILAW